MYIFSNTTNLICYIALKRKSILDLCYENIQGAYEKFLLIKLDKYAVYNDAI